MQRSRFQFTLLDLLAVFVIAALLLALLLPILLRSHIPAGRATCMNNQKQLTLAMLGFEASRRRFPGYVNRISSDPGGNVVVGSWVPPLFPYLDRMDLWRQWRQGNPVTPLSMTLMTCPSDPYVKRDEKSTHLSYVVNCGHPGDADTPAHGIFHNHNVDKDPVRVSLNYVNQHDGSAYTLLFSENIQAGFWTDTNEANVGMVWLTEPVPLSRANCGKRDGDRPQGIYYARPSSYHTGGVIVSYCDGRQVFLREDIDYNVYQHLMTPDSKGAGVVGEFEPERL
jgi:hypothetical protein